MLIRESRVNSRPLCSVYVYSKIEIYYFYLTLQRSVHFHVQINQKRKSSILHCFNFNLNIWDSVDSEIQRLLSF